MLCVALYSSALLYGLDNTIVADVQAPVVEAFDNVKKLGWIGIGFPLGSIATILPFGRAYGLFDIKKLYIASLVNFAAGTALCGGAPSMNALIIGRVWAGAGGAGEFGYFRFVNCSVTDWEPFRHVPWSFELADHQYHYSATSNLYGYNRSCLGRWLCTRAYYRRWLRR